MDPTSGFVGFNGVPDARQVYEGVIVHLEQVLRWLPGLEILRVLQQKLKLKTNVSYETTKKIIKNSNLEEIGKSVSVSFKIFLTPIRVFRLMDCRHVIIDPSMTSYMDDFLPGRTWVWTLTWGWDCGSVQSYQPV